MLEIVRRSSETFRNKFRGKEPAHKFTDWEDYVLSKTPEGKILEFLLEISLNGGNKVYGAFTPSEREIGAGRLNIPTFHRFNTAYKEMALHNSTILPYTLPSDLNLGISEQMGKFYLTKEDSLTSKKITVDLFENKSIAQEVPEESKYLSVDYFMREFNRTFVKFGMNIALARPSDLGI